MSGPLRTDLYELNMAASYLARGMNAEATFSLAVRELPPARGFLVAAGLESCLEFLENFGFDKEDLEYLASIGFSEASLEALSTLHFTGEVWAVPEGRVVLANEPLLEVTAPIAEAQLVETFLLNQITFQTNVATKALRCRVAGGKDLGLVEFGMRRAQGLDAAYLAARASAIGGFQATSDVEAARRFGLAPAGTMAHSYIESFPTEIAAFRAFAQDFPARATFLIDTYDTLRGATAAIEVIKEYGLGDRAAVRIDSGDLTQSSTEVRQLLDESGLPQVRIMVSGGLDEHDIAALRRAGAPIDAVGVGTRLVVAADAPFLDTSYKLVQYDGRRVAKLSADKVSLPGAKQVFRAEDYRDQLALREETTPSTSEALLVPALQHGRRVLDFPVAAAIDRARERCGAELDHLPERMLDLVRPEHHEPVLTPALAEAARELYEHLRGNGR